jgi:hypothetical protein
MYPMFRINYVTIMFTKGNTGAQIEFETAEWQPRFCHFSGHFSSVNNI